MHRNEINNSFYSLMAGALAVGLYVVGRFGFTDILGIKRVLEVLIFLPVGILGLLIISQRARICLNPFFMLPATFFILQFYWKPDGLSLSDLGCATLVVGIILALGPAFSDRLLRNAIKVAAFFATLGLIEFLLLLFDPALKSDILLFYDDYSGSTVPMIENVMQLFGLSDGTTYHLWGMTITRLRSFASEPSLLVGYFLIPGALALTYGGRQALLGLICIAFSICSLAGSVFAAVTLSLLSSSMILCRSRYLYIIGPFIGLTIFIWILGSHYNELILLTKTTSGGYDFLDKTNSANMRFSFIRDVGPQALMSPFGLSQEINQPLGLLVSGAARGGYFGFILILFILMRLFGTIGDLLIQYPLPKLTKIGLLIIYGSLLTGILYLDNCFIQIFGFTLLLLIHNRLQYLQFCYAKSEKVPINSELLYSEL